MTNRFYKVKVTTGKANKWVATNLVAVKDFNTYKEMLTRKLYDNKVIRPTTEVTFTVYSEEEIYDDNEHYVRVGWVDGGLTIVYGKSRFIWREFVGVKM